VFTDGRGFMQKNIAISTSARNFDISTVLTKLIGLVRYAVASALYNTTTTTSTFILGTKKNKKHQRVISTVLEKREKCIKTRSVYTR